MGELYGRNDLREASLHPELIFMGQGLGLVIREVGNGAYHTTSPSNPRAVGL